MNPAEPVLIKVRYLAIMPWLVALLIGSVAAGVFASPWAFVATGFLLVLTLWLLWLIPAQVRNLGWQETEDELLLTKGKLWHTLTVVPYGRIQFVDVGAGPIERACGLAHVELHTASSSSDALVRGLDATAADALRVRLTERAREQMSGL